MKKNEYVAVLYGDIHFPYVNEKALSILYQVIEDIQPDLIVDGGDGIDNSALSSFPNFELKRTSLLTEMEMWEKHLKHMKSLVDGDVDIVWLQDNHFSMRLKKFIAENPALNGVFRDIQFEFDEVIDYNVPYFPFHKQKQNKIAVIHGYSARDNFTKLLTLNHNHDMIQFHTHTSQMYRATNGNVAFGVGCMCKTDMAYLHNRPTRWVNQFAILKWYPEIKKYTLEYVTIDPRGVAVYNGKIYKGVALRRHFK